MIDKKEDMRRRGMASPDAVVARLEVERAYDGDGREIPPMTLGNMREHGVRTVEAL